MAVVFLFILRITGGKLLLFVLVELSFIGIPSLTAKLGVYIIVFIIPGLIFITLSSSPSSLILSSFKYMFFMPT